MDENKLLDDKPSLKLKIKYKDKEGTMWLSGIYGSHKYESDIEIPKNEEVLFFCPTCSEELLAENKCEECNAHMVRINLNEGGRVIFCSREGCVNHSMEFKQPETAMKLLYNTYAYERHPSALGDGKEFRKASDREKERKEIIKSGTYLYSYCPHCKKALMEDNEIKLDIIDNEGKEGKLSLSPYFNVFQHKTTIRLSPNQVVKDIKCPHCHQSLVTEIKCPEDTFPAAKIMITAYSKMVDFYFCTKPGCKWHGLDDNDEEIIALEDRGEW